MNGMFSFSLFNGDLLNWDISNVKNINKNFYFSKFSHCTELWNPISLLHLTDAFSGCPAAIAGWCIEDKAKRELYLKSRDEKDMIDHKVGDTQLGAGVNKNTFKV